MKKFGTPSGAAPGVANEKLGLAGVGTPPGPRVAEGFGGPAGGGLLGAAPPELGFGAGGAPPVPGAGCCEGRCGRPEPFDLGGGAGAEVLVVFELEDEPEELDEPEDEGELGVLDAGGHDSEELATGAGSDSEEADVPGGTLNESVCPETSVTVRVHWLAEAVGSAATANVTTNEIAAKPAILSFRLIHTVVYLLPPCAMRKSSAPRPHSGVAGKLLTARELCNAEPFVRSAHSPRTYSRRDRLQHLTLNHRFISVQTVQKRPCWAGPLR